MLRDSVRSFLADKLPAERVVQLAESDEGWDASGWKEIAQLGWIGLSVPEERGGAGMSFLDEAVVFEELGRALYPGPYLSSVALALPLIEDVDLVGKIVSGEATATLAWAEPSGAQFLDASETVKTEATGS